MVSFRTLIVAAAACAAPALAALGPPQTAAGITALTRSFAALQGSAEQLTLMNGITSIATKQGPLAEIMDGFNKIIANGTSFIEHSRGSRLIQDADRADRVYDTYRGVREPPVMSCRDIANCQAVRPRAANPTQHSHWKSWPLQHCTLHRRAHRRATPSDRGH
jgi:hypothetical protein